MSRSVKITSDLVHPTTTLNDRFSQIQNSAPPIARKALVTSLGTTVRKEVNVVRGRASRTNTIAARRSMVTTSKPAIPVIRTAPRAPPRSVIGTRPTRQTARPNLRAKVGNKPKFVGVGNRQTQRTNGNSSNNSNRTRGGNNSRGGRGGGGGGRRNGRGNRKNSGPLSKETLDKDLDEYMSNSKAGLDRELEEMMSERTHK